MPTEVELLTEMRDLLRVMAEPALAERDARLRKALAEIVGKSKPKAKAVGLMDGSRNQAAIIKEAGVEQSVLSKFVKALRSASLIAADEKHPKLLILIPPNFFDSSGKNE